MSYTYQYPRTALKDLPELAFDHDEIMTDAITLYGRLTSKNEKMRTASIADLDEISQLEALCFPPAEAASRDAFKWRLLAYPTHFWVLEQGGKILSFINGPVTQEKDLKDEMYDDPNFCDEEGEWQMVFGVVTHPKHQHQGLASRLMQRFIEEAQIMRDVSSDESIMKDGEDVARIEMGAENYDMSRK